MTIRPMAFARTYASLLLWSAATTGADFALVRDGRPQATIVLAAKPTPAAEFAAAELRHHVQRITGALLPMAMEGQEVRGPRILLGESTAARALGMRPSDLEPREYLIRFLPDALVLLGRDQPSDPGAARAGPRAPEWTKGKFGAALRFNGSDTVLRAFDFPFPDAVGSMEAWIWMPAPKPERHGTILRLDGGNPWTYHIVQRDAKSSRIAYRLYDGAKGSGVTSKPLAEGWHHILATHSTKTGKVELFIDGVSQGQREYSLTTCKGAVLGIGAVAPKGASTVVGNPFAGVIDEVRISSVVREPSLAAHSPDGHTALLLHFDEGRGRPRVGTSVLGGVDPPEYFEPKGTLNATYDFLERFCRVRWYLPGELGTALPATKTLVVGGQDVKRKPAMEYLWITPTRLYVPTWDDPVSGLDVKLWKLRMRIGGVPYSCNHSFYGYYDRFLKTHPEWFAQGYDGRPPQMCFTNEGFRQNVAKEAREFFDGGPAKTGARAAGRFFGLVPMDNSSYCKCAACQSLKDPAEEDNPQFSNGLWSGYVWGFVNGVARKVRKTHPDSFLSALAYSKYAYYPKRVKLEPNVAVQMCLHMRNWWVPSMEANDRKVLRQWSGRESGKRPLYLWLYYNFPAHLGRGRAFRCFPGYFAHTAVKQMKLYHDAGIRGIFMEHSSEVGHPHMLDLPDMYVTFRLADDPTLDGDKVIDEFFDRFYGAAAQPMRQLYLRIEDTFSNPASYPDELRLSPRHHHQTEEIAWGVLGRPERMAEFGQLMAQARAAARTDLDKARVELFDKGVWQYMVEGRKQYLQRRQGRLSKPPKAAVPRVGAAAGDPKRVDWSKAAVLGPWQTVMGDPIERKVDCRVAHDGKFLYIRLEEQLDTSRLVAAGDVWSGDDWELFFARKRTRPYRQFAISPNGSHSAHRRGDANTPWDSGVSAVSDTSGKDRWVVLLAFPLEKLLDSPVSSGQTFYANFYRASPRASSLLAWSPPFVQSFHSLGRLGELVLR